MLENRAGISVQQSFFEIFMKKLIWILLAGLVLTGCEAAIGDKCETSNDCPNGMVCDTDSPSGYCLVYNCENDEECPEDGTCVFFTDAISYCLKKCDKGGDCRSNYSCRDDIGTHKFCYIEPEYPYGRDESNEVGFTAPAE